MISSKVFPVAMYIFQSWELHQEGESKDMVIISFQNLFGDFLDEIDDKNVTPSLVPWNYISIPFFIIILY